MKLIKKLAIIAVLAAAVLCGNSYASMTTILPLAARTATTTSTDITKTIEVGAHFILNATVVPGADTITMKVQGKDNLGNYYDLLVGTASAATGIVVLKVSPSITPAANASANDMLPDIYRIIVTHSAGTSFTYSVTENTWTDK